VKKKTLAGILAVFLTAACTVPMQEQQLIPEAGTALTAFAAEQTATANPVISRNVPAFSGGGTASHGNDDAYWTAWQSGAPDYLAYDLSGVPAEQRQKVIAVWYNDSSYDNLGGYVSRNEEPIDYVIEINKAAGGSCPADGWETAVTVTDNGLSSRQHLVEMNGANWIRIRVTKAMGDRVKFNFDVHDASQGVYDSWIFFGDSITASGMVISWGTSYAAFINRLDPRYTPIAQNGGIGGIASPHGRESIDGWLKDSPVRYVSIAYGTNDCWGNPNNAEAYYDNTKYMIDAVLNLGKIPVLPTIPSSTNADVGPNVGYYNEKIKQLYTEYSDKIVRGPDFEVFFQEHPDLLSADGVHPSSEGYEGMRQLWAETMYETVYQNMTAGEQIPSVSRGDVDLNGDTEIADAVMLQKYLLAELDLTSEQAKEADLNGDGRLNAVDFTMMRGLLMKGK